jgi:hypothetical protein
LWTGVHGKKSLQNTKLLSKICCCLQHLLRNQILQMKRSMLVMRMYGCAEIVRESKGRERGRARG